MLVLMQCNKVGIEYLGYSGRWKAGNTVLRLHCPEHGIWEKLKLHNFLKGISCRGCGDVATRAARKKSDDHFIDIFLQKSETAKNFIFCNLQRKQKWRVKCKICSEDEYTKAGVCTGVFDVPYASLLAGHVPCRCAKGIRNKTDEQRVFRANQELEGTQYTCLSYCGKTKRLTVKCEIHGNWQVAEQGILRAKSRCPACAKTGFDEKKPAVFYVLKVSSENNEFIGFGISNNFERRISNHRVNCKRADYGVEVLSVIHMSGADARDFEREVKSRYPKNPVDIEGFRTEATYVEFLDQLLSEVSALT